MAEASRSELLRAESHLGTCRVICYSPRHDLTLAELSAREIVGVVDVWASQVAELSPRWRWVQVFENNGEMMGCSNPHPHGQIWATDYIPNEPAKELAQQQRYFDKHATPLLLDYAAVEISAGERVVLHNSDWLAVVPWWAVWPFETIVIPCRRHVSSLPALSDAERETLASLLGQLTGAYNRLFDVPFPYSFGWHGSPGFDGTSVGSHAEQLHAHFYPPLLRSATVRKFMVGYELLAEPQRDITPERAAAMLREALRR